LNLRTSKSRRGECLGQSRWLPVEQLAKFGELIASSKAAERTIRLFVISRKNRLFCDMLKGVTASSTLQIDLDCQTQRQRVLRVAAPRIGAPTAGDLG